MQPGARRTTMTQVAARAGVSVMTVSYTYSRPGRVSADTRDKVLQAAAELGYAGPDPAARSLRYGSTQTLGVILGEHLTYAFDDPQATAFLAGIAEACAERGHGLLIVPVTGALDDARRVAASAVDAFVVWTTSDDDEVLDAVAASGRPVVVHGGPAREGFTLVSIDNRAAAFAIGMETFAGAQRPAVLSFPLDRERSTVLAPGIDPATALFPVTRERLLGYRDAIEALGLDWADVLVGVAATNDDDEACSLAEQMLSGDRPVDAIAAMSDEQALGVLRAAASRQVPVPTSLTVSGWDDSTAAAANALSSVAQDLRAQGAAAARLALGGDAPSHADQWSVVARTSTTRPLTGGPTSDRPAEDAPPRGVRQLRLVVEATDYEEAVAFYRDVLGLPEQAAFQGEEGAKVVILDAGRATLEIANPAQARMIDEVEVGRRIAPHLRVAFEVDDATAISQALVDAGAEEIAPPTQTPWRSLNARLQAPAGLQITVFEELEPLEDRAARPGFGTDGARP